MWLLTNRYWYWKENEKSKQREAEICLKKSVTIFSNCVIIS